MMNSENDCKTVMSEGIKDQKIKDLFNLNKPYISPYISKSELTNIKIASK